MHRTYMPVGVDNVLLDIIVEKDALTTKCQLAATAASEAASRTAIVI